MRSIRIGLLVAIVTALLLCGAVAVAESSGTCGSNLTWRLNDEGTLTISGTGAMSGFGWPETGPWGNGIKSVIIEEGVTSIGSNAFYHCSSLTSITIPASVTSIGNYAFQYCSGLTSITIPEGVTSIGWYAFSECSSLTSIAIPEGVTSISSNAFNGCSSLTSITIPEGVTSIGGSAFGSCSGLTSIAIPESVTSIGQEAFHSCSSLTSIAIPDGVTSIGKSTFYGCSSLMSVAIPEGVTSIGESTFYGCSSLTSIAIPESVTSIGDWAFRSCNSLTSITIPEGVTSIGSYAFAYCYYLSKVVFLGGEENLLNIDGSVFEGHTPTVYCYMFSPTDSWCSQKGITPVYLDDLDINTIRTVSLPNDFRMACGDSRRITAVVFPAMGDAVTWQSSEPNVVSVTAGGTVTALAPGQAVITATVGNASDSVTVETYIVATGFELNESELWVLAKDDVQLSVASYEPANADAEITWRSSDTALATVNENGLVSTIKPGDVTITATTEKGVQRQCLLHLCYPVSAVELTAPYAKMPTGRTLQLTANVTMRTQSCVNHLVTFSSSDESVATVDAETGLVRGVAPGTVTVTATSRNNKTATIELQVMDACDEHTVVTDPGIAPTHTETGLTEGSHCSVCNEVLVAQAVIPALDDMATLRLPEGLTAIDEEAFMNDTSLEAVIVPDDCASIGARAFAGCTNLIYIRVPANCIVAANAFEGCGSMLVDRSE